MQQERNYRFAPGVYPVNDGKSGPRCADGDAAYSAERMQAMPRYNDDKVCGHDMVLAMAYVRSQPFENLYTPDEAWKRGTFFMDLDLPYGGGKC